MNQRYHSQDLDRRTILRAFFCKVAYGEVFLTAFFCELPERVPVPEVQEA